MTRSLAATLAACAPILITTAAAAAPTPAPDISSVFSDPPSVPEQPVSVVAKENISTAGIIQIENIQATLPRSADSGSDSRGVAEDFLVLPDGADLGGRLRMITADDGLASVGSS
jgi:hypothetical protein